MKSIEMTGKTVEDAVSAGVKALGCDPSDVKIDVLDMGSPGLFGMFGRLAKVRLTVKEDDSFAFEMPEMSLNAPKKSAPKPAPKPAAEVKKPEPKPAPRAEKPAVEVKKPEVEPAAKPEPVKVEAEQPAEPKAEVKKPETRPERAEKPASPKPPRKPRPAREEKTPAPLPERVPFEEMPVLNLDELSEAGRAACEFLKKVTAEMGAGEVEMRVLEKDGNVSVAMMGDELGILIGRRGETLDSLQYLTSLVINKEHKEDYIRVKLDTEDYRSRREATLRNLARNIAYKVRRSRKPVALEPMNPYERRIIHSALQNDRYVTTRSEGEEPFRHVIIFMKKKDRKPYPQDEKRQEKAPEAVEAPVVEMPVTEAVAVAEETTENA